MILEIMILIQILKKNIKIIFYKGLSKWSFVTKERVGSEIEFGDKIRNEGILK